MLMVGLVFAMVGSIINDFETQYPDINVNTSWEDEYDYRDEINESVSSLKDKLDIITDEEEGWFSKIAAGITAVPRAIILVPVVMFETISYGLIILVKVGNDIGIPSFVIAFTTIAVILILIFKLISFFQRSREI